MSVDATIATWKLSKKQVTPIQKLILLSYADRVGESFECWPSNSRLELDTGLDRHTICENKQKLIEKGLIVYTGEKRGRTKSIDVIRLTYVKAREHSHPDAENPSSVKKPTAKKLSSVKMPIPKQCGNAHTESLSTESLITTTTVFSEQTDKELLSLRAKNIPTDERTPDEFLKQCKWHIDNQENKYTTIQRLSGLKKLIQRGSFETPGTYPKAKSNGTGESDLVVYSRYIGGLKTDMSLGLLPPDTIIPDFQEWQRNRANVSS